MAVTKPLAALETRWHNALKNTRDTAAESDTPPRSKRHGNQDRHDGGEITPA
jgi:hypothetical protein